MGRSALRPRRRERRLWRRSCPCWVSVEGAEDRLGLKTSVEIQSRVAAALLVDSMSSMYSASSVSGKIN